MSPSFRRAAFLVVVFSALVGGALAAETGAQAVKVRQTQMKALGAAGKVVGDQFRSGKPDPAIIRREADKFEAAARILPNLFPAGSGREAGVKTRALPAIWSDPSGFAAAVHRYAEAAGKADAAAQKGDMAAVGGALSDLDHACNGCHDKYRAKEHG
ncbi:MAG TPA: cytochrome c [Caulobacteraceae bacterium]|nr:cytochrome c [Caulobacteraceae bacterium]